MARGINKVILVATLGKDPEMKYAANGNAVCNFSVATSEGWNDKQTGEKIEKTEWHNIVLFGKIAEICGEYLKKGSQVYLEGKLQTDSYEKEGVTRYSTKVVCNLMQMLGSKGDDSKSAKPAQQKQSQPAYQQQSQQKIQPDDGFDDDIPF